MGINQKAFDKEVISFLRKQPQHFGDISHIATKFIDYRQENVIEVRRELVYLKRDRDIIYIKDIDDVKEGEALDDWWGDLVTFNIRDNAVTGLKAKFSKHFMDTLAERRHSLKREIIIAIITALLSIGTGYTLLKLENHSQEEVDGKQNGRLQQLSDTISQLQNKVTNTSKQPLHDTR